MKKVSMTVSLSLILGLLAVFVPPSLTHAACLTTLAVSITSGPYLLVDANKPGREGPMVATISAVIENTGTSTAEDIYVYVGNGTAPGIFGEVDGQSLAMAGDVSDASRYIGDLGLGESKTIFWQLAYPPTFDKTYPLTVWTDSKADCSFSAIGSLTTRSSLTAASNKLLGTVSIDPPGGIVNPGNVITVKVTDFNFGQVGAGPSGEEDAWLQPVGNLDFNPSCFRLVKTIAHIDSIENGIAMPVADQIYFDGIPDYDAKSSDYVEYYFIALKPCTTTIQPYQEVASGTVEKYSKDYGSTAATIVLTSESGGLSFHKDVNPQTAGAEETLTWTITYGNTTAYPIGDPATGNGLVVIDEGIPEHTTYVASSAACSNNCTIFYFHEGDTTWTTTESPADQVTKIKWHIEDIIPASTDPAGTISFQTVVNPGTLPGTTICNTASAHINDGESLTSGSVCANTGAPQVNASKQDSLAIDADSSGAPSPGDTIEYTIVISNDGSEVAQNVVFTDTPGANTGLVVGSISVSNCSGCLITSGNDPGDVSVGVDIGELAPQESVTIYFRVIIGTDACFNVSNQGLVSGTNFDELLTDDPDTATPNDPTVTSIIIVPPSLTITKSGPEDAVIDSMITYIGTLSNTSSSTVYNVVLIDFLPDDVSFVSSSHTADYDSEANTVTWQLGDLPPGSSVPGWLTVYISPSIVDNTDITNEFSVIWDDCEGTGYGPSTATWDTTVHTHPQLTVTKSGPEQAYPEETIVYTITIENIGGTAAEDVVLTDTLQDGLSYVSSNPEAASHNGTVTWNLGTIGAEGVVIVTLTASVDTGVSNETTLSDSVEVNWTYNSTDYGPVNDTWDTIVYTQPKLAITKLGPEAACSDSNITYTGTLTNVGGTTAYDTVLVDYLPDGVSFVSSSHAADYDPVTNTVTWELGELPPGTSIPGWLTVHISSSVTDATVLTDTFSVTWKDDDDNGAVSYGPATANWDTTVYHSQLSIEKSGPEHSYPGQSIDYTIKIENLGSCDVSNVILSDILPLGLSYVSSSPAGMHTDGTVTWSLGSISGYGTAEVSITVEVDATVENNTPLLDTAIVTWEYPSGQGMVSDTQETDIYTRPHLTIEKTGPDVVQPDEEFDYSIQVCNAGGTDAVSIKLVDFIPDGLSYVTSSNGGTHSNGEVTWTTGPIVAGDCQTITLTVEVVTGTPDGTMLENISSVSWSDSDANNYGPVSDLWEVIVLTAPDLQITKTGPTEAHQGDEITYEIEVCNSGGTTASNITLTDILPIGLNYVTSSDSGEYDEDTHTVTWNLGPIADGNCQSVTLTVTVDFGLPEETTIIDVASVIWDDYGPRSSTAETRVNAALILTKNAVPEALPGNIITYDITYVNLGTTTLTGVVITEVYDPYVSYVSATPIPDTGTNNRWTIGELVQGASGAIEVSVRVSEDAPDGIILRNKVHLTTDQRLRKEATDKTTVIKIPVEIIPGSIPGVGPAVGGFVMPVSKIELLKPWIVSGVAVLAGIIVLFRSRTHILK